jgi:hypothetical protein
MSEALVDGIILIEMDDEILEEEFGFKRFFESGVKHHKSYKQLLIYKLLSCVLTKVIFINCYLHTF